MCKSYYTLEYLLAAFLAVQLVYTLPYIMMSAKQQRNIQNQYAIPGLQAEFRAKFNLWIYMSLVFMIIQTIALLILASECPLVPMRDQDGGARAKSVIAFLLIPLSQAMIDLAIVYISSYALRSLLPEVTGTGAYVTIWILSFAVTALQLIFKLVDTKYDMLIAMLFPLFKLIPFFIAMRDSFSSGYEYRQHIINDRETSQGKLVAYYRLYDTFV